MEEKPGQDLSARFLQEELEACRGDASERVPGPGVAGGE